MQHSNNTADYHYAGKDVNKSAEQLSDYFVELDNQLLKKSHPVTAIPSGNCSELSKPEMLDSLPLNGVVTVNCGSHEGCLFCSKYRIHADETDIRKLLSLKYFIIQSQNLAASQEHFDSVYKSVLTRIESLLGHIGNKKPSCLTLIKKFVKKYLSKSCCRSIGIENWSFYVTWDCSDQSR
ncbi:hypothetical protein [Colwellia sp. E150_009]